MSYPLPAPGIQGLLALSGALRWADGSARKRLATRSSRSMPRVARLRGTGCAELGLGERLLHNVNR